MTDRMVDHLFESQPTPNFLNAAGHIAIAGQSGTGKTQLMGKIAIARLHDPLWGLHIVDPEGELSPIVLERAGNTRCGLAWRKVHYFRATSSTEAFAIPLLYVRTPTPQACHETAVRARTVIEHVLNFGLGEFGPRLSKLLHLGLYGLALTARPLVLLPDLFGLGSVRMRQLIGDAFPYQFVTEEWRSLDVLGERNPSRYLEYTESLISRMLPIFGNAILRRVFGPQPPIDLAHILAHREVALLDLAGLEHKDSVLIGTSYASVLYHEALQRPSNRAPHACVLIDEVFDYMTPDLARGFDRLRKRNVQLCIAFQRLGQLQ